MAKRDDIPSSVLKSSMAALENTFVPSKIGQHIISLMASREITNLKKEPLIEQETRSNPLEHTATNFGQ